MERLQIVQKRFKVALENQRDRFNKFNEFDYIYNCKLKKYDPTIPSKVFNPILWSFVETIVTRLIAKNPVINYKPRESTDTMQAQIMSDLFEYWYDKSGAFAKIVAWVKDALVYGTGIVKIDWLTSPVRMVKSYVLDETGQPMVQVDEKGKPQFVTQETPVIDYDDPRLKNVNIYDFFYDPAGNDVNGPDGCAWVGYQYKTNISDLEKENESAKKLGKILYNVAALNRLKGMKYDSKDEFNEQRREAAGGKGVLEDDETLDKVLIWEMWENDHLTIVGNEAEVLYDGENPYWHGQKPFIKLVDSIVSQEFYGKGEIEPVEKQLHALNTIQNQRITNVNRILSPMWKAKDTVDDDELQFMDNGIIHVNDLADVDMIASPNVTQSAVQEQTMATEVIQRALGVTDYVQGVQTPGQTAAEVETKTAQANARFAHKVKILEETGLKQLGDLIYQLYQQFITKEKVIRVVGPTGELYVPIGPGDIAGEYDVIPESNSTLEVDQEAEFRKFLNLFTILQPYIQQTTMDEMTGQPVTQGFLSQEELVKRLIEKSGEKDSDKFWANQGVQNGQNEQMAGQLPGEVAGGPGGFPQGFGGETPGVPGIGGNGPMPGMETPI